MATKAPMVGRDRTIRQSKLNEICYSEMKEDILRGVLKKGTKLEVNDLALQFKVSRAPIVKAIERLSHEGLVEVKPNRGSFVKVPSEQDIRELSEIRVGLEQTSLRLAMQKAQVDLAKSLRDLQNTVEWISAGRKHRSIETKFFEYDRSFHSLIVKHAHNRKLNELMSSFRSQIELFRAYFDFDGAVAAFNAHEAVVVAVELGDSDRACASLQKHIEEVKEETIRDFAGGPAADKA